jgi:hypothetical protein
MFVVAGGGVEKRVVMERNGKWYSIVPLNSNTVCLSEVVQWRIL